MVLDGDWQDGDLEGQGTMTLLDGSSYSGHWKAGKQHGKGIYRDMNGSE